jgi:excisionase family DNA binding protein
MNERIFTLKEVADQLRVNYRTIYREVHSGRLVAYQVGQQWRISESELRHYLERNSSRGGTTVAAV